MELDVEKGRWSSGSASIRSNASNHRQSRPILGRAHKCSQCNRGFDRKDSLTRHMRVHDKHRPSPTSKQKACGRCVKSKIRCTGERPSCSSCSSRHQSCIYPRVKASGVSDTPITQAQSIGDSIWNTPTAQVGMTDHFDSGISQIQPDHLPASDGFLPLNLSDFFDGNESSGNLNWIFQSEFMQLDPNYIAGASDDIFPADITIQSFQRSNAQKERRRSLPTPEPRDGCSHDDPWPMEWNSKTAPAFQVTLPILQCDRDEHTGQHFFTVSPLSEAIRDKLEYCLRLPSQQTPWNSFEMFSFPSKGELDHCIDLYFAHFHPIQPVIHRPTFDPAKSPIVTLAVVCIGACYTNFSNAQEFSDALSELNRRVLLFMAEADRRFVRTEDFLIAQLLQGIHGFSSGNERLFELSESYRSNLVHHAKCMGLFRNRTSSQDPPLVTDNLETCWEDWIQKERLRRISWAVYEYDSSVAYMQNNRPYLSISELQQMLPSSHQHWEAETAHAWAALHPWSATVPPSKSIRPAMRTLFDGTENPMDRLSNHQHRLIIIITILRMVWTCKEMKGSPLTGLVNYGFDEGRERLLRALNRFIEAPLTSPHLTRLELMQLVQRQQLIHAVHIYTAEDLMNWLYPLLRNGAEAGNTKHHLRRWSTEAPAKVREVACHSAQALALARQFPSNHPSEPFMIFHSGVVLFCAAMLLPAAHSTEESIRLDYIASPRDQQSQRLTRWVQQGGKESISIQNVPLICSDVGAHQVLDQTIALIRRTAVWGISQKFANVIQTLYSHRRSTFQP